MYDFPTPIATRVLQRPVNAPALVAERPAPPAPWKTWRLEAPTRYLSRRALLHNLKSLRGMIAPSVALWPAVKADAYGHGLVEVARVLDRAQPILRPQGWCVARLEEAMRLRDAGITGRIIVLAPIAGEPPIVAATNGIELVVAHRDHIEAAISAARNAGPGWRLRLHIKIDTGMGRQGCAPNDVFNLIDMVAATPLLELAGVMSHLARADEAENPVGRATTEQQIELFAKMRRQIEGAAPTRWPSLIERFTWGEISWHVANSAGIAYFPDSHHTMVRPGLALYGIAPDGPTSRTLSLKPALSIAAPVAEVASELPMWAVAGVQGPFDARGPFVRVSLGSVHGYSGHHAGLASMMIDDLPWRVVAVGPGDTWLEPTEQAAEAMPKIGTPAIVMGQPAWGAPTAVTLAQAAQTIPYEITCGWRLPVALCE